MPATDCRRLIRISDLSDAALTDLFARARAFRADKPRSWDHLRGRFVVNLFYENSTRTRVSFEVAAGASMLGGRCLVAMKNAGLNVAMDTFMTELSSVMTNCPAARVNKTTVGPTCGFGEIEAIQLSYVTLHTRQTNSSRLAV